MKLLGERFEKLEHERDTHTLADATKLIIKPHSRVRNNAS